MGDSAAVQIRVDSSRVVAALNRSSRGLQTVARAELMLLGIKIAKEAQANLQQVGAVDTQRLFRALDPNGRAVNVTNRRGKLTLTVDPRAGNPSVEPYDVVVENGRRAGAKMPPRGALLPWMARHGWDEADEYILLRSIARKGIKGRPYMEPAFRVMEFEIDDAMDRLGVRVAGLYGKG